MSRKSLKDGRSKQNKNQINKAFLDRLLEIERRLDVQNETLEASIPIVQTIAPAEAVAPKIQVRTARYYISEFDPDINDFGAWCDEVEEAKTLNDWTDRECLSRVASNLRGASRSWLRDWVIKDRSWSKFVEDFGALCPREIDEAEILAKVMGYRSEDFPTYAEYARKTIMKLNIITKLHEDIKMAILLRGITDPQVKASAANAGLTSANAVEHLRKYAKPKISAPTRTYRPAEPSKPRPPKRNQERTNNNMFCFGCGQPGHKKANCFKKRCWNDANESDSRPKHDPPTSSRL